MCAIVILFAPRVVITPAIVIFYRRWLRIFSFFYDSGPLWFRFVFFPFSDLILAVSWETKILWSYLNRTNLLQEIWFKMFHENNFVFGFKGVNLRFVGSVVAG